ncbi:MAG: NAD(P)-dependent oxidoreductase [Candidatus Margulisbacteria bacterium]|nr:NAD(P)-dependent oxidoreductase [Candidatus Margulisiibacteriota bacterium]
MKILIAGGAGYIGSLLAPALLDHGYQVDVIDLLWFGNHLPPSVRVIKKDLFTCHEIDLKGYDHVIFLAGLSNDPMAEYNPAKNFIDNGALPSFLAYRAKNAGVKRFIYASSCSVYGHALDHFYTENDPVICDYPYGISKLQGEKGVLQMTRKDFSVIALRQGTVCGHSPRMRMDLIINTMFKTAMTQGKIIVNNASIWRPIYDIRDAIIAYLRAIQADESVNGIFNVCSGNFTVGAAANTVREEVEQLTGKKIELEIKKIEDFRNYKVSIDKAKAALGFEPRFTIKDIVKDLYLHRNEYGDCEKDEFYNIRVFKKLEADQSK